MLIISVFSDEMWLRKLDYDLFKNFCRDWLKTYWSQLVHYTNLRKCGTAEVPKSICRQVRYCFPHVEHDIKSWRYQARTEANALRYCIQNVFYSVSHPCIVSAFV